MLLWRIWGAASSPASTATPWRLLSAQLGISMHTIGPDCDLLLPDGSKASKLVDTQVREQGST